MLVKCLNCEGLSYNKQVLDDAICFICDTCGQHDVAEFDKLLIDQLNSKIDKLKKLNDEKSNDDVINHPDHYISHPSGVECLEIVQHMDFCLGNAIKYIWRCEEKGKPIEDLKKAIFYLERKIQLLMEEGY